MSMEGKTSACAHLSPMGNLAAATADLWSNESVQNIKLLGGMAPTCYMEQLIYDCRLLNQASSEGPESALKMRDWLVNSDAGLDPQAMIISPESSVAIASAIVSSENHYKAGIAAARQAIKILHDSWENKSLKLKQNEISWLGKMSEDLDEMPDNEETFIEEMMDEVDTNKFVQADYGLPSLTESCPSAL